tara:strand:- start:324 stop:746 length:423 start_codon:yes stop_codon:yes gene_type:complete
MAFEGLICPACSNPLDEKELDKKLICPHCSTKLKQKKFLAFLEFLMMHGLVSNIDFFDHTLYGDEIKKTEEEVDLEDETNPDDFENKTDRMDYIQETPDLKEVTTDEEEFREWEGLEEDWEDFNKSERKGGKEQNDKTRG